MKILLASRFSPLSMAEMVLMIFSLNLMLYSFKMTSTSSKAPELIDSVCTYASFWLIDANI